MYLGPRSPSLRCECLDSELWQYYRDAEGIRWYPRPAYTAYRIHSVKDLVVVASICSYTGLQREESSCLANVHPGARAEEIQLSGATPL
jgi:hypothetical protein